jgi:hypothetical protein
VVQEIVYDPLALENMELLGRFSYGVLPDAAATPYLGPSCYREFTISGASDLERDKDLSEISLGIVMAGTGGAINSNIANLLAWAKSGTGGETIELCHQFTTPLSIFSYGIAQMKYDSPVSGLLLNWYGHARAALPQRQILAVVHLKHWWKYSQRNCKHGMAQEPSHLPWNRRKYSE